MESDSDKAEHTCTIFFASLLLLPCTPPSMPAFPNRSPFSLWRSWRAIWSLWTDTPHWDSALQRAQDPPFCVYRLRTVSLLISQHLMTTEHENRNANVTLWVRGKACPAFCGQEACGVSEMHAYSRGNAIPGRSHSQRSEVDQALVGFLSRSSFERQLDILIMSCKCMHLYNASDYSASRDKPHVS